jgi:hypothetical protein
MAITFGIRPISTSLRAYRVTYSNALEKSASLIPDETVAPYIQSDRSEKLRAQISILKGKDRVVRTPK